MNAVSDGATMERANQAVPVKSIESEEPTGIDLLLVDDDPEFRGTVARRFMRRGYHVVEASDGEEALDLAQRRHFGLAILDLVMPGMSGLEVLKRLKQGTPDCQAVLLTGQGSIETAVEAMKLGAFDYITKPFPLAELELLLQKAYAHGQLSKENTQLKAIISRLKPNSDMIGESNVMRNVYRIIERAGPTDKAIVIQGESGVGKELVARALHRQSNRADKPLVVINCAALPENLLESELFGHEKGSFTGAIAAKPGLFEVADGGTLFIDEIGELPGALQAKLLRVLEDGSMRRVGSLQERRVNVRILAATNRNLAEEVRAGRFREDLYYRINVMSLEIPPLRQRTGDIPLLVAKFLGEKWRIEAPALEALEKYAWPGNVRQLINALDRAQILADDCVIRLEDLPEEIAGVPRPRPAAVSSLPPGEVLGETLSDMERAHVVEVLRRERGNKARAARALGVSRRSLYRLLDKYGLREDHPDTPMTGMM